MTSTQMLPPIERARMISELTRFLLRNFGNPAVGWPRRMSTCDILARLARKDDKQCLFRQDSRAK